MTNPIFIKKVNSNHLSGKIYAGGNWPEISSQEFNFRNYYFYEPIRDYITELKQSKDYLRILNMGCGDSDILETLTLCEKDYYHGVDLCPLNIQHAKTYYEDATTTFEVNDANEYISTIRYNLHISTMVWHHLSDLEIAAQSAYNSLEEGGHLVLITPNFAFLSSWVSGYTNLEHDLEKNKYIGDYVLPCGFTLEQHDFHAHTLDSFMLSLRKVGFKNIQMKSFFSENPLPSNNRHEFLMITANI